MRSFSLAARSTRLAISRQQISRPFTSSVVSRVRHSGQSSEEFEQKKDEQVKKGHQGGKGEWHEGLASSSESHVKADQEKVRDHDDHIEELQKKTADAAEKEKK